MEWINRPALVGVVFLTCFQMSIAASPQAGVNGESAPLRAKGADEIYNLDRDLAAVTYQQAVDADPRDAAAYRGLATTWWLSVTLGRGNMTVDDYLGRVTSPDARAVAPPPATDAAFRGALDHALALSREQIAAHPRDPEAHYQLGAALGLKASYMATAEESAVGAFRAAREAYQEHETVVELDPGRRDADLTVGTYRYVVASLALPFRWMAYVAGFGGGKARGIRLIEEAAAYPGDSQTDARIALVLVYNREHRYDDALAQLRILRERYPRNRLFWLESGSTNLRAGRAAEAGRVLETGMSRFASDPRPRMFGEDALWHYKRGTARARLRQATESEQDLRTAVVLEGRPWVHGRARLELGKLELIAGSRSLAIDDLRAAISLCESDRDAAGAEEARRLADGRSSSP